MRKCTYVALTSILFYHTHKLSISMRKTSLVFLSGESNALHIFICNMEGLHMEQDTNTHTFTCYYYHLDIPFISFNLVSTNTKLPWRQ